LKIGCQNWRLIFRQEPEKFFEKETCGKQLGSNFRIVFSLFPVSPESHKGQAGKKGDLWGRLPRGGQGGIQTTRPQGKLEGAEPPSGA